MKLTLEYFWAFQVYDEIFFLNIRETNSNNIALIKKIQAMLKGFTNQAKFLSTWKKSKHKILFMRLTL